MAEIVTQEPLSLEEALERGCLCCSELANGLREDGAKTCGDPVCGVIVKPLPTKITEEQ